MTARPARKTRRDELAPRKAQTLEDGILAVFPVTDRKRLEAWKEAVRKQADVEVEFLLFLALICGTQYRVIHPDAELVLKDLRDWLTNIPKSLKPEVADVVIEALRPRIQQVMQQRGWWTGSNRRPIEVRGRPQEATGAWAAAVLVDAELCRGNVEAARASDHAKALASTLLGRSVAPNEFYRVRTAFGLTRSAKLLVVIRQHYESRLTEIGRGTLRPRPPERHSIKYGQWRAAYRDMRYVLAPFGCEGVARATLESIPGSAWPPSEEISDRRAVIGGI